MRRKREDERIKFDDLVRASVNHYYEQKYDVSDAGPEFNSERYQQGLDAGKMEIRKNIRKKAKIRRGKRIGYAVACGVIMLTGFLWLDGNFIQAELMFNEHRETGEEGDHYSTQIDSIEQNQEMIGSYQYEIGYIPEGYELTSEYYNEAVGGTYNYQKDGVILNVNYCYEKGSIGLNIDNNKIIALDVTINDEVISVGRIKDSNRYAYWMWEQEGVFFYVMGDLTADEYAKIYQGIR